MEWCPLSVYSRGVNQRASALRGERQRNKLISNSINYLALVKKELAQQDDHHVSLLMTTNNFSATESCF